MGKNSGGIIAVMVITIVSHTDLAGCSLAPKMNKQTKNKTKKDRQDG